MSFHPALPYSRADPALELDVLTPHREAGADSLPVAIFFHGGGWHEGDRGVGMHSWLNPLLAARGSVTVSVTYAACPTDLRDIDGDDSHEVTWLVGLSPAPAVLADV